VAGGWGVELEVEGGCEDGVGKGWLKEANIKCSGAVHNRECAYQRMWDDIKQ